MPRIKKAMRLYAGFNDEKAYTYPATLETVSTFKNVVAPFSNNCKYSGGVFTCDRPTLISYIRTAGSFAGVRRLFEQQHTTDTASEPYRHHQCCRCG